MGNSFSDSFFVIVQNVQSQSHFQIGLNGMMALPQGVFKDNIESDGFGGGIEFLFSPRSSVIGFGASVDYVVYGWESRDEIIHLIAAPMHTTTR